MATCAGSFKCWSWGIADSSVVQEVSEVIGCCLNWVFHKTPLHQYLLRTKRVFIGLRVPLVAASTPSILILASTLCMLPMKLVWTCWFIQISMNLSIVWICRWLRHSSAFEDRHQATPRTSLLSLLWMLRFFNAFAGQWFRCETASPIVVRDRESLKKCSSTLSS